MSLLATLLAYLVALGTEEGKGKKIMTLPFILFYYYFAEEKVAYFVMKILIAAVHNNIWSMIIDGVEAYNCCYIINSL